MFFQTVKKSAVKIDDYQITKRIRNKMFYRMIGEGLGLLFVMILVSYLQNDSFSIDEIIKILIAYMLHKGAVKLEVRYFLSSKLKKLEKKENG